MDYFQLTQDHRIANRVEPVGSSKIMFDQTPVQIGIKAKRHVQYVDFIERPIPLVSDELKQLMKQFEPEAVFAPVVLFDALSVTQHLYWAVAPQKLKCLSAKAEFHKNATLKRLVIDEPRVTGWHFFQVDQLLEPVLVFDLILVESMLRRDFSGFRLNRIEVDGANT